MENNFYVGVVYHGKRLFKPRYKEKIVLYSEDQINYLDLRYGIYYTTNRSNKYYVEKDSIVPTDISLYREDYNYMLSRYKENPNVRRKKIKYYM